METSTVSSKYQIVIPKKLRQQLKLRPGQVVSLKLGKANQVIIEPKQSHMEELAAQFAKANKGRKIWGEDPDEYIRKERESWN